MSGYESVQFSTADGVDHDLPLSQFAAGLLSDACVKGLKGWMSTYSGTDVPVSEEVLGHVIEGSEVRLTSLKTILPLIHEMVHVLMPALSEGVMESIGALVSAINPDIPEEKIVQLARKIVVPQVLYEVHEIMMASSTSILSQLVEYEVLYPQEIDIVRLTTIGDH